MYVLVDFFGREKMKLSVTYVDVGIRKTTRLRELNLHGSVIVNIIVIYTKPTPVWKLDTGP